MKNPLTPMTQRESSLGWIYFTFQLIALPSALQILNSLLPKPLDNATLNALGFGVNLAFVVAIFHRFLWQDLLKSLEAPSGTLRPALLGFFAYELSSYLLSSLIYRYFPEFINANNENIYRMARTDYTLMAVGTVLLVPVAEEVLYRGLLFDALHKKSRIAAYAVSTAVFAAIHVIGYIGSASWLTLLISFVQYIPAGVCLAWAYEHSGSIWTGILIHMTVNQIGILSMR